MTHDQRLVDQVRYYRHRAPEYDETAYYDVATVGPRIDAILDRLQPSGTTLELACGTGIWTQRLAPRVTSLFALDSSVEALTIARRRTRELAVTYAIADVFSDVIRGPFQTVFFAAWLSHVPTDLFEAFFARVTGWLAPGGRVLFVDEGPDRGVPERFVGTDVVERRTNDGTSHRLVKVLWSPAALTVRLQEIGWNGDVADVGDGWIAGTATPLEC